MTDSYYKGEPTEESRQQYATERIQQLQAHFGERGLPLTFEDLRRGFVTYGDQYDLGYRLSDGRAAA